VGLKPREQTCLGSSIAAAGGRLEGRKLQASQRAKQKHTGAGSDCLRLPAPSPSPHARARDKEATRGREKGGGRSGAVSEHAPRRRRADLPESGAGSAALTVSASRPRDLTPRRPLGLSERPRRRAEGRCSGAGARLRGRDTSRYIEGKDCAWLRRRPSSGSAIAARGEKKEQGSRWNWESDGFLREGAVIWPQKEESFLRSPPSFPRSYTALRSRGRQSDWSFGNGEGK